MLDTSSMTLPEWLDQNNVSKADLAKSLGVSPEAVRVWCVGRSIPRQAMIAKIRAHTGGQVTANDFFAQEAA